MCDGGIACTMLEIDATEITFASITGAILLWMFVMMNRLYAENLKQNIRIVRLSYGLQLAEYRTGEPYYSGISIPPMEYEPAILAIYKTAERAVAGRKRALSM